MRSVAYNSYAPAGSEAFVLAGLGDVSLGGVAPLLERLNGAVILVERPGIIACANRAAAALLAEGTIFREQNRLLVARHPAAQRLFDDALLGEGTAPLMKKIARVHGDAILWLIPLREDGPLREEGGRHMIVLVTVPEPASVLPAAMLMEAFGLTAAEARVLAGLMKGHTIAHLAEELRITCRTVKAHLQRLFDKTGTRRQADLVSRVLALTPSFRMF
ncbi:MAG: helix-turn-helix transcriptional regulator [Rhizomicrobium sp.]|jgi:DNA-binding CsgD family transcriptional regulator